MRTFFCTSSQSIKAMEKYTFIQILYLAHITIMWAGIYRDFTIYIGY